MKNIFSLLFATSYLVGCSSVSQPVATRALVEYSYISEQSNVPSRLWPELSVVSSGNRIVVEQKHAELGQRYFSANGRMCRKLLWVDADVDSLSQIICKSAQDESWQFVKPVMSEYIENRNIVEAAQ